jgi:uncharacterized RmlC-like cupin family protein
MMNVLPRIIEFPEIGNGAIGYIAIADNSTIPFDVKRIYWTYLTPENVERGGHAHRQLEQVLVAVSGTIKIKLESQGRQEFDFILDRPGSGLYIPGMVWRTIQYSHNAVQLCIASTTFDEQDYIRDYETFIKEC